MIFTLTSDLDKATSEKYRYQTSQIYWTIIGRKVKDGPFYHMDPTGALTEVSTADNQTTLEGYQNNPQANYSHQLSTNPLPTFNETLISGRLMISLAPSGGGPNQGPYWVHVNSPTGLIQPSPTNDQVAGYYTIYDKLEFTYEPDQTGTRLWINTTCVDFLGIPIDLTVDGVTAGFNVTRADLITAFQNQAPTDKWGALVIPGQASGDNPLRILSPANALNTVLSDPVAAYFQSYWSDYINNIWNEANDPLTLNIDNVKYTGTVNTVTVQIIDRDKPPTVTGTQQVPALQFSEGTTFNPNAVVCTIPKPGAVNDIYGASNLQFLSSPPPNPPGTLVVMGNNQILANGDALQKNIEKVIAAAMCRTILQQNVQPTNGAPWSFCDQSGDYYTNAPVHHYADLLHMHAKKIHNVPGCYAFSYDDVCEQSSSLKSSDAHADVGVYLPAWD